MKRRVRQTFLFISCMVLALGFGLTGCQTVSPQIETAQTTLGMEPDFSYAVTPQTPHIHVDSYGYRPDDKKVAFFSGENLTESFEVREADSGKKVFEGSLRRVNTANTDALYTGDFSMFQSSGNYYLYHETLGESYEFTVSDMIYTDLFYLFLKEGKESAGENQSSLCYLLANLLFAKELYPESPMDDVYLRKQAEGLLSMQDETGRIADKKIQAAFLKTTGTAAGGAGQNTSVWPVGDEVKQAALSQTAQAAGVLAGFSQLYRESDSNFANQCLIAAQKAYIYLEKDIAGVPGDALYFAAAQLYRAGAGYKYRNAIRNYDAVLPENRIYTSQNYELLADFAYLSTPHATDFARCEAILESYLEQAQEVSESSSREHYYVRENMDSVEKKIVLKDLVVLGIVNHLLSGRGYEGVSTSYIHYYMGANPENRNYLMDERFLAEADSEDLSKLLFVFGALCH